jgi:hypothetical protein
MACDQEAEVSSVFNPKSTGAAMTITIKYVPRQSSLHRACLDFLFYDIEWALNRRLQKFHHQAAKVTSCFMPGKVTLEVTGSDLATVEPYMVALQEGMNKDGFRVLITYDLL